eukprot:940056-Pyramimonas_sp.AAC.1
MSLPAPTTAGDIGQGSRTSELQNDPPHFLKPSASSPHSFAAILAMMIVFSILAFRSAFHVPCTCGSRMDEWSVAGLEADAALDDSDVDAWTAAAGAADADADALDEWSAAAA